jgi:hypothetical protein
MKRFFSWVATTAAVGFFFYLAFEFFERAIFGDGDPLVPLLFMVVIIIGSALFQIAMEIQSESRYLVQGMSEIKGAVVIFVSQSRTETEYLQEVAKYYKTVEEMQQKPDLN